MSLRDAFRAQADACSALGSPFTARLLRLCADRLQPGTRLTDRLFDWPGDIGAGSASVPLRLMGALHGLVLDNAAPGLARLYPPQPSTTDDALWTAVEDALNTHAARLDAWLDRPPQTNETGRSAVLIAAGHWLTAEYGLPLKLSELGASAGLNLMWDRFALALPGLRLGRADQALTLSPDWRGDAPFDCAPRVVDRRGVDLTPLDPQDPGDCLRLLAYLWPDQPDRLARTRAAIAVAEATVERDDAAGWLETRLAQPAPGTLHLIYHTIAWQYFPPETAARARGLIEAAGARATGDAPLAWLGMEADGQIPGAGLSLRLWPGDRHIALGRADFHGRWVDWRTPDPTSWSREETA
ncbi:MAG: DUF2332 family protein [Rhodobacter sp.]|nr:DUF2332 family protein [Rhodobacter sp.]